MKNDLRYMISLHNHNLLSCLVEKINHKLKRGYCYYAPYNNKIAIKFSRGNTQISQPHFEIATIDLIDHDQSDHSFLMAQISLLKNRQIKSVISKDYLEQLSNIIVDKIKSL